MNDVFPYSFKQGHIVNRKEQKSDRIPNHHKLPDLEPNDKRMSIINVRNKGKKVNK